MTPAQLGEGGGQLQEKRRGEAVPMLLVLQGVRDEVLRPNRYWGKPSQLRVLARPRPCPAHRAGQLPC